MVVTRAEGGDFLKELYFAYGSNLNIVQMDNRCPLAQLVSRAVLEGYELAFRCGVLTILPKEGGRVDGILWKVNDRDERALDRYEGYPRLYTKETLTVQTDAGPCTAVAYVYDRALLREGAAAQFHILADGFAGVPGSRI